MKKRKQRSSGNRGEPRKISLEGRELPSKLIRDGYIYLKGEITKMCHGLYHVHLENGMDALCTARKLDAFMRISLLDGDQVIVELNPLNLNPSEKLRARIVWRVR